MMQLVQKIDHRQVNYLVCLFQGPRAGSCAFILACITGIYLDIEDEAQDMSAKRFSPSLLLASRSALVSRILRSVK